MQSILDQITLQQLQIGYEPMTDPNLFYNQLTNLDKCRVNDLLKYKFWRVTVRSDVYS